ncbi:hypothetical protein IW152_001870 [Coemansia sp. BCRC 34962]|nr:hypothetical protein IW152_001870 [Coemansia sp. BCRC 34962]
MFIKASEAVVTRGSTLILPTVSIGNVPQLGMDLLINTLQLSRIGIIDDSALLPVSGIAAFDHITSRPVPLEVYQSTDAKWTLIQQRSPPLPKRHRLFAKSMLEFIKAGEFDRVVLLTSSDAALRTDALIDGPQIRSISVNCDDRVLIDKLQALSLTDFGHRQGMAIDDNMDSKESLLAGILKQLHAAGIARPLLDMCQGAGIPVLALVSLVNEGDNISDAITIANAANAALGIATNIDQWHPPQSWQWLMPDNVPSELF